MVMHFEYNSHFETTMEDDTPATVCFKVGQPERDVGIFTPYIEDIWLTVQGKRAEWLEKRLTATEWHSLEERALEEYYANQ
jgi:hypothetical protein